MHICTVEPPPGFVISLHCLHRALAVRGGKKNMQFTSLCFPSLGLGKPAGIPGDDMNKRQNVAKRGNRHRGTQEAASAKPNSIPQMALHPSRIQPGGIFPCPKAVLHLGLFWSCWSVCRMNAVHTFQSVVVSQLLLPGLLFQNTPQSSDNESAANEGFLLFQV